MAYLGLDIGTTRCKACIFSEDGKVFATASREYNYSSPKPGWAEQDPEEVWYWVKDILREVGIQTPYLPKSLSISAQGEAVIFIDKKGKILRPTILGMDMRSVDECEILSDYFGKDYLLEMSGVPLHPITSLAKILWVRRNQPDIFDQTEKFLLYEDFIFWKLGGVPVIDFSMASKTLMFDIQTHQWSKSILNYLGIPVNKLAIPRSSGEVIGKINPKIAEEIGLSPEMKLVVGGHDQCCAPLGAGSIRSDIACDNMGTAEIFSVPVNDHHLVLQIQPKNFSCYCHVIPEKFLLASLNQTCGLLLKWYRDNMIPFLQKKDNGSGIYSYEALINNASQEPAHIFVLPHLVGSGTPWIDALSKGAIIGLTLNTDQNELIRAMLEGIVFEQKVSIELFEKQDIRFQEIHAVGGCSKSLFWLQIRADILGKPVKKLNFEDGSVIGAAMLAAYGDGAFVSLLEAAEAMTQIGAVFEPQKKMFEYYQERFEIYRDIYSTLKDINRRIK